jgi:predicted GH43/DUF377 family glycosyl hydrolase
MLGVLLVAGCGTASTPSSGAASPVGSTGPASRAFTFPGGEVANVTRALAGRPDERFINPGAVLVDEAGTFHMFANAFTAWPGLVHVPHLTSTDGVTWTLAASSPALTSDDVPFAEPGADVSTAFVTDDGTWTLVFETVNHLDPWVIGRATAPGPDGPWTIDPQPILEPGAEGDWDAGGLSWPSVVRTDDGWAMYYAASDQPRTRPQAIGLATSADGVTWTKHDGPVMTPSAAWEGDGTDRPRVQQTDADWLMVYTGRTLSDRGLAWSADGATWTPDQANPVITADDFPVAGNAWDTALLWHDGVLRYYMEIGTGTATGSTDIYLATPVEALTPP